MVQHQLLEDKDLVRLYQQGDQHAISELVRRYKSKVFSSIYFLVRKREVAEDLFQETFIKIITCLRRDAYNEQGKFLPWVLRIAHNLAVDHFRVAKRIPEIKAKDDFDVFDIIPSNDPNCSTKSIDPSLPLVADIEFPVT